MAREGFESYGIDGSETAVKNAKKYLESEKLLAHLEVGDVINLEKYYQPSQFDAVVDVLCLSHNRLSAIQAMIEQAWNTLKPGGKIFSMMFAVGSYGDGLGEELEPKTFLEISDGPLKNRGTIHFSSLEEVQALFAKYENIQIEYSTRSSDNRQHYLQLWVIQASKPI